MIPYEDLSRLLDHELPPAEAEALRLRIAQEPAVAAAWATMQALPRELAALPGPASAPPPLRATVRQSWAPWLGAVALAAAILLVLSRQTSPELVPGVGAQRVVGNLDVWLPQGRLHVDGRVGLHVEPPLGLVRDLGPQEDPMDRHDLVAALAGAAITVSVYEGSARLFPTDGSDVVVLDAGTQRTLVGSGPRVVRSTRATPAVPARPELPGDPTARLIALDAENAELRERLERAQIQIAVQHGQLVTYHGEPIPWPADIDASWRPDAFRSRAELAAKSQGATVRHVDCDEYPCVVAFDIPVGEDPHVAQGAARAIVQAMSPDGGKGRLSATQMMEMSDDGSGMVATMVAGFLPEDTDRNDAAQVRLKQRAETLMEEANGDGG